MRTIEREVVSALLFSKDGQLLLGKTAPEAGGVYSGSWIIPGGGMEPGESKLETLHREVLEETGLDISNYETKIVEDGGKGESEKTLKETGERVLVRMNFYTYEVRLDKTADELDLQPTEELAEVMWVPKSELKMLSLSPPTIKLLNKLGYM